MDDLSRKLSRLDAIVNALPDLVIVYDENGLYVEILGGKEHDLYATGDNLKGRYLQDVLPKAVAKRFLKIIKQALKSEKLVIFEYQLNQDQVKGISLDGPQGTQWFEARVYPIQNQSETEPRTVVWLALNISQRKHLEQEVEERRSQIEALVSTDALTGSFNRRKFFEIAKSEIGRFQRFNRPLSVIMIDIDQFKQVNDIWGHDEGDNTLKQMVFIMKGYLREVDVLVRWGGDEFIILEPETPLLMARTVAERLRCVVLDYRFPVVEHVTISMGVAEYHINESITDWVKRADNALYKAKQNGRNRVEIAS